MLDYPNFAFDIKSRDKTSLARTGVLKTPHGDIETPNYIFCGTKATVKNLSPCQLKESQTDIILSNTYHLMLQPGADLIEKMGGLHKFMNWDGPMLTDSGGFQVFSLAQLTKMDDQQVAFRSHIDGSLFELSPEKAVKIQEQLGADCIMCLDECPPHDVPMEKMQDAVDRTTKWAARCRDAQKRDDQALFGIVQGGTDQKMRERSAEGLLPLEFPGYAVGGLSVGEKPEDMYSTLDFTTPMLPVEKPRYLMGVGRPSDLIEAIIRGVDLFDCVMPTRNGRNGMAFTSQGRVNLRNQKHARDPSPLDPEIDSPGSRDYSRAYLRHLFMSREMLGPILISLHNIAFYQKLLRDLRQAILNDQVEEFRAVHLARWNASF